MSDNQKQIAQLIDFLFPLAHPTTIESIKLVFEKLSEPDKKIVVESSIEALCIQSHSLFDLASMEEGFDTNYTNGEKTFHLSFKLTET